jgi:hypothetical protein
MDKQKLNSLTKQLLNYCEIILRKYEETRESNQQGDFYKEVKPFSDDVRQTIEQWGREAVEWIKINQPRHIHIQQIQSVSEQIEMLSVQAFFPNTGRARFINTLNSVTYILNKMVFEEE